MKTSEYILRLFILTPLIMLYILAPYAVSDIPLEVFFLTIPMGGLLLLGCVVPMLKMPKERGITISHYKGCSCRSCSPTALHHQFENFLNSRR